MSQKKATPKAVFEACQQLSISIEEGASWNRDDVRLLVGGGSFAVIDPLIKAWRKLQPIREVAPTIPSELLIQVAALLEQQVTGYINEVQQADERRELLFNQAGEELAENLHRLESRLTAELESAHQANHDLESECSRLEGELTQSQQEKHSLELRGELMEKELDQAGIRLVAEKDRADKIIQQNQEDLEALRVRMVEQNTLALANAKLDYQQQLAGQKVQLLDAAELAENRLMRLLDQSRSEIKEAKQTFEHKLADLNLQQQEDKQLINKQKLEINVKESELKQVQLGVAQQVVDLEAKVSEANHESRLLRDQLLQQQSENSQGDRADLQAIKDSILSLQGQLSGRR